MVLCLEDSIELFSGVLLFDLSFQLEINLELGTANLTICDALRLTVRMSNELIDRYMCDEEVETHHISCCRRWCSHRRLRPVFVELTMTTFAS